MLIGILNMFLKNLFDAPVLVFTVDSQRNLQAGDTPKTSTNDKIT